MKGNKYDYTLIQLTKVYRRAIGITIKRKRKACGLSVNDLALHCEVSIYAVRSWLYDGVIPGNHNLVKLDNLFK